MTQMTLMDEIERLKALPVYDRRLHVSDEDWVKLSERAQQNVIWAAYFAKIDIIHNVTVAHAAGLPMPCRQPE